MMRRSSGVADDDDGAALELWRHGGNGIGDATVSTCSVGVDHDGDATLLRVSSDSGRAAKALPDDVTAVTVDAARRRVERCSI